MKVRKHRRTRPVPVPTAPRLRRNQNAIEASLVYIASHLEGIRDRAMGMTPSAPGELDGPSGPYVARMESAEALAGRCRRLLRDIETVV